jgi:hypothetical protein
MSGDFSSMTSDTKGMTLVEVMLSVFLGGMVLMGLSVAFAYGIGLWGRTERKLAMHADGNFALESIMATASMAESHELGNQRLVLTVPASPLDPESQTEQKIFRLTDQMLWGNDSVLIPFPGDSGIGVADFRIEEDIDGLTGIPVLELTLCLFSRETLIHPSDSMWFESRVHLRNRSIAKPSLSTGSGTMSL